MVRSSRNLIRQVEKNFLEDCIDRAAGRRKMYDSFFGHALALAGWLAKDKVQGILLFQQLQEFLALGDYRSIVSIGSVACPILFFSVCSVRKYRLSVSLLN